MPRKPPKRGAARRPGPVRRTRASQGLRPHRGGDAAWLDAVLERVDALEALTRPPRHPRPLPVESRAIALGWLAHPDDVIALLHPPMCEPCARGRAWTLRAQSQPGQHALRPPRPAPLRDTSRSPGSRKVDHGSSRRSRGCSATPASPSSRSSTSTRAGRSTADEHPPDVKERGFLRTTGDVFPHAQSQTRRFDSDHPNGYDADGPPGETGDHNQAPLGRRHHRRDPPRLPGSPDSTTAEGLYLWRTPHGLWRISLHGAVLTGSRPTRSPRCGHNLPVPTRVPPTWRTAWRRLGGAFVLTASWTAAPRSRGADPTNDCLQHTRAWAHPGAGRPPSPGGTGRTRGAQGGGRLPGRLRGGPSVAEERHRGQRRRLRLCDVRTVVMDAFGGPHDTGPTTPPEYAGLATTVLRRRKSEGTWAAALGGDGATLFPFDRTARSTDGGEKLVDVRRRDGGRRAGLPERWCRPERRPAPLLRRERRPAEPPSGVHQDQRRRFTPWERRISPPLQPAEPGWHAFTSLDASAADEDVLWSVAPGRRRRTDLHRDPGSLTCRRRWPSRGASATIRSGSSAE